MAWDVIRKAERLADVEGVIATRDTKEEAQAVLDKIAAYPQAFTRPHDAYSIREKKGKK